ARLAEVAVEIADVVVFVEQLSEIAKVFAEVLWIDGGVFPTFPRARLARNERRRTEPGLADFPDALLVLLVVIALHRGTEARLLQRIHHLLRVRVALLLRVAAELHEQPSLASRQQRQLVEVQLLLLHVVDQA